MKIQSDSLRFTTKPDVVSSVHENGIVLLNVCSGRLFASNNTGARIWSGLEGRHFHGNDRSRNQHRLSNRLDNGSGPRRALPDRIGTAEPDPTRDLVMKEIRFSKVRFALLVFTAFLELLRYEIILRVCGSGRILRKLNRQNLSRKASTPELERSICDAVLLATCFHWRPVLCLQRSVCTAKLLRTHGIKACVVIGYRPLPFFFHAWVEVDGRIVYGSPAYQRQLSSFGTGDSTIAAI